ncbi:MAG: hypothetical protein JSS40_18840 [Proteobacteria bacterium]|nr:hypothetical protein [Pseudomonadota bacterium]
MKTLLRNMVDWCVEHPREAIGGGMAVGSVVASAAAAWLALWLNVRDHGTTLTAIQAEQTAQATTLKESRAEVLAEQRRDADERRRWQEASLQRDLDISVQLGQINRTLGLLQGQLQRAAMWQGWGVNRHLSQPEATEGRAN